MRRPAAIRTALLTAAAVLAMLLAAGCATGAGTGQTADNIPSAGSGQVENGEEMKQDYIQITQEKAKEMMAADDGHVIVDVRRQDEFDAGHIPGAVCIPNESIGSTMPEGLPELDQVILVYCRSGNRSKQAAEKLARIGYTGVYEFGGIIDWTGEIVTGEEDHMPEADDPTDAADEAAEDFEAMAAAIQPVPQLVIRINGHTFYADPEDNPSADAFVEKLKSGPLEVQLEDYGDFEKVGALPFELPRTDERITTVPGDVILYQGDQITIYYDENTWNFTRLARIGNVSRESLLEVMGEGGITAEFSIEWSE